MVIAGVIKTSPRWPFERRLLEIAGGLREVIREHRPELAAVEEVFHAVNAKSALKLAHVRGVALLVIGEAGLALAEYSPLEVKMSVVGYGRAEKVQVQMMVRSLLGLRDAVESLDACDALAEYSPLEVKMSVVGYGRAEKVQVQMMVRSLLGLRDAVESLDACDALAVAICYAAHEATGRRLGDVGGPA